MTKPYFGNRFISRRDLLYAFYGFPSFATLVGCSSNPNSGDKGIASNTSSNVATASNNSANGNKETKVVRCGARATADC